MTEPTSGASYVDVRALGVGVGRGVRHWVRRPAGVGLQGLPALCGATSRRGWVAMPSRTSHDCEACQRQAEDPPDKESSES